MADDPESEGVKLTSSEDDDMNKMVVCVYALPAGDVYKRQAVGRVRSVTFSMFNLQEGETFPREIRYLKYLESVTLQSNTNRQIREMDLGEEIGELEHLKNLTVNSYGLKGLPANFVRLGQTLEKLDLGANNFAKLTNITTVVNKTNFPKLKMCIRDRANTLA